MYADPGNASLYNYVSSAIITSRKIVFLQNIVVNGLDVRYTNVYTYYIGMVGPRVHY